MTNNSAAGKENFRKIVVGLLAVIVLILITVILRIAESVLIPITLAFFLAALMSPIQNNAAKHLPRKFQWLGVVLALFVVLMALTLFALVIWMSVSIISGNIDPYVRRMQDVWNSITFWLAARDVPLDPIALDFSMIWAQTIGVIRVGLSTIIALISGLALILILLFMMLNEESKWEEKSRNAFNSQSDAWVGTMGAVAFKLRRFLLIQLFVSMISGISQGLFLWLVGVDFALVWGVLTFFLNFIPFLGSLIAAIPPVLIALLDYGLARGLLVVLGIALLNLLTGSFLTPQLEGYALSMSPLVILISIVYWGWVWGVAGAFLATPILAAIMVICANIPALEPVALLISGVTSRRQLRNTINKSE